MPIDIGEIVGTSPSDVLAARPSRARRRSRDESVDNYLDEEFLDRATKQARLQFAMTGEARAVAAERREENKSFTDESERLLKIIRQHAAQMNLSPEETRKFALDYLGPRADTPVGEFILGTGDFQAPDVALQQGTSLDEATDLFIQAMPPGPKSYALAKKSGLLPPERDIPTMTARELESAYDEIKAEVDNFAGVGLFTLAKTAPPGSKPTTVHRMLNRTLDELPAERITDQQIYIAAQLNRRRMFEEIDPERTLGIAESAFLDALKKQTRFDRQTRSQEAQTQTIGELLDTDAPPDVVGLTVEQLIAMYTEELKAGNPRLLDVMKKVRDKMKGQP